MTKEIFRPGRLSSALVSGSVAIALNSLALKAADLIQLPTAHGGLLRLLSFGFSGPLTRLGIARLWSAAGFPASNSATFQVGFHLFVGLLMALFYAFVLEPVLPWQTTVKGLVYTVSVWLLNALIVLPATGEGVAGSANLSVAGIAWYAAAHALFFMLLAYGFAFLMRLDNSRDHP